MKLRHVLFALVPLMLAGCGLSPQQKADYARVENSGVSPAIYDKMVHDDDLSVSDIEALSRAHVGSGVILRYIRDEQTNYFLRAADVSGLEKAGVDPSVIDYMLQSARNNYGGYGYGGYGYGGYGPYGGGGFGFDPFWYPGFYGGYYGGYYGGGSYGGGGHHR